MPKEEKIVTDSKRGTKIHPNPNKTCNFGQI